jgi:hypothetical protein
MEKVIEELPGKLANSTAGKGIPAVLIRRACRELT